MSGSPGAPQLPAEVSTIAGLGAMLLTCWQSKAQISDRYGTLADAVLGGHRSKVFFSGIDDPSTVEYLSKVAGTEHVPQRSWSVEVHGHQRSVSEHAQREDLLPSHVIRQMAPQDAVLIHGTLPPIHLQLVRWWQDTRLRRLVPTDRHGRPQPPTGIATCPLSGRSADRPGSLPDIAALEDPAAHLPTTRRTGSRDGPSGRRGPADATNRGQSGPGKPTTPSPAPSSTGPRARAGDLNEHSPGTTQGWPPPKPSVTRKASSQRPPGQPSAKTSGGSPSSRSGGRRAGHRHTGRDGNAQPALPFDPGGGGEPTTATDDDHEPNRAAGICEVCTTWVPVGKGQVIKVGRRLHLRCYPNCPQQSSR